MVIFLNIIWISMFWGQWESDDENSISTLLSCVVVECELSYPHGVECTHFKVYNIILNVFFFLKILQAKNTNEYSVQQTQFCYSYQDVISKKNKNIILLTHNWTC